MGLISFLAALWAALVKFLSSAPWQVQQFKARYKSKREQYFQQWRYKDDLEQARQYDPAKVGITEKTQEEADYWEKHNQEFKNLITNPHAGARPRCSYERVICPQRAVPLRDLPLLRSFEGFANTPSAEMEQQEAGGSDVVSRLTASTPPSAEFDVMSEVSALTPPSDQSDGVSEISTPPSLSAQNKQASVEALELTVITWPEEATVTQGSTPPSSQRSKRDTFAARYPGPLPETIPRTPAMKWITSPPRFGFDDEELTDVPL